MSGHRRARRGEAGRERAESGAPSSANNPAKHSRTAAAVSAETKRSTTPGSASACCTFFEPARCHLHGAGRSGCHADAGARSRTGSGAGAGKVGGAQRQGRDRHLREGHLTAEERSRVSRPFHSVSLGKSSGEYLTTDADRLRTARAGSTAHEGYGCWMDFSGVAATGQRAEAARAQRGSRRPRYRVRPPRGSRLGLWTLSVR